MDSQLYQQKAEKYKMKYTDLKLKMQQGGLFKLTNEYIMDIIELYDKTYNLYVLYRFRYDNTEHLINFNVLTNLIFKLRKRTKHDYDYYYIKDLLESNDVQKLVEKSRNKVLFTLRQDTTKLLRNVLLFTDESKSNVDKYIKFIDDNKLLEKDFAEIHDKCIQIKGLVSPDTTEFKSITLDLEDHMNTIRYKTNQIINKIGDDYDNSMKNIGKPNNLDPLINKQLNTLFTECFNIIEKVLKTDVE